MDMVERIAMAIHDERHGVGMWASLGSAERRLYRFEAHAVLKAMKEHSPEQEKRMNMVLGENTPATRRWHWVWYEMIDAALATEPA